VPLKTNELAVAVPSLPATLGAGMADDRHPECDRRLGYDRAIGSAT
jgi:hypothetical protein